jgi:hypothetical protein
MNWDAIGAIGEAFGAIALFLVLVQVRHARGEVRRSVTESRLDAALQRVTQYVDNERLNALNVRAIDALGGAGTPPFVDTLVQKAGMTRQEAFTLMWNEAAWWLYRVQVIAQIEHMPLEERTEFDDLIRENYRDNPVARLWWEGKATVPNRAAVRYVDNLLAQPG